VQSGAARHPLALSRNSPLNPPSAQRSLPGGKSRKKQRLKYFSLYQKVCAAFKRIKASMPANGYGLLDCVF